MKNFIDILTISRKNVRENPDFIALSAKDAIKDTLKGIIEEVEEVEDEVRENNEVYLTDELSDIVWDYARLLAVLEREKLITNAEGVFEHGFKKYTERLPAMLVGGDGLWNETKQKQKLELKKRHQEKYGE